jgi:hypothetical protein
MRICTAVSRNALPYARVLAASVAVQHPGAEFVALVVDDLDGALGEREPFRVLSPLEIGVDERELCREATMYTTQQLVSALKSRLLRFLLGQEDTPLLLFDADVCVYSSLEPLLERARLHQVVISPHSLEPLPSTAGISGDKVFMRVGVFNGGFLGIGSGAERFLDWWTAHSVRDCVLDLANGLHLSQSWLALVPALFEHHVLRDPGSNVMAHNLAGRDVELAPDGRLEIAGAPLRFFHFTMFDPATRAWRRNPSWWWIPDLRDRPGTARLCDEYAERLYSCGYAERVVPRFERLPDGRPLTAPMRRAYRDGLLAAERAGGTEPPNPFVEGARRFDAWLAERVESRRRGLRTRLDAAAEVEAAVARHNKLAY